MAEDDEMSSSRSAMREMDLTIDNLDVNLDEVEGLLTTINTTLDTPRQEDGHGSSPTNPSTVRKYGEQPDGDLIGEGATGEAFSINKSFDAGEEFVSDWFDTDTFTAIAVFVNADEPSAINGVKAEYTDDAQAATPRIVATEERTYTSQSVRDGFDIFHFPTELDGVRIRYQNNSDAAGNVDLIGTLQTGVSLDSAEYVNDNVVGDTYVRVGTSESQKGLDIGSPTSLFDDMQTVERRSLIDLASVFGTSGLRDEVFTTGSGSLSQDPDPDTGEIELSTGTTADSSITVQSEDYGRYTPGFSAQAGVGLRVPNPPTEGEIRWGYFDGDNGFYWGYDGDQQELFVARIANGTEQSRVYESNFNGFNFENKYDQELLVENGYIYQIDFSWYGYGIINFSIVAQSDDTASDRTPAQDSTILHSITVNDDTSIADPNQPLRVIAENGATGEDVRARIGGRQYSVLGDLSQEGRITADTKTGVTIPNGSWNHVMSWRRRNDASDGNARMQVDGFDFGGDATLKLALVKNADITGTTFVNPTITNSDETLIERSFDGTFNGINGGSKVWESSLTVPGTGNAQESFSPDLGVSFGQATVVSLLVQGLGESGTGTSTMRIREDW